MGAGGELWGEVAELQAGVIARRQLLANGLTPRQSRRALDSGRWRQWHPGVYLTFTGPVSEEARIWAAVLYAGAGAAVGGRTALWLAGAVTQLPEQLEIWVPHPRQVRSVPGLRIRRARELQKYVHPVALPPRVRLEVAVLDVADRLDHQESVVDVVLRVIQRRLTTASRLTEQLKDRPRHRWRRLLMDVLVEATGGVASALELRYTRDVERAHGLPPGCRNHPEDGTIGRRYHDVRYESFGTVVELDGREAHPVEEAFRDLRRDNMGTVAGDRMLRYGWRDVAGRACAVAAQVGGVLHVQGWTGTLRRCGPACLVDRIG
jgi:hypothetical protein